MTHAVFGFDALAALAGFIVVGSLVTDGLLVLADETSKMPAADAVALVPSASTWLMATITRHMVRIKEKLERYAIFMFTARCRPFCFASLFVEIVQIVIYEPNKLYHPRLHLGKNRYLFFISVVLSKDD